MDKDDMKEEQVRALEGLVNPTQEQKAEAKALGLVVVYQGSTGETRIETREETRKFQENWDEEMHCCKSLGAFLRAAREASRKQD